MSLRKEFVLKALSKEVSVAALCRDYGISRKTGYKWIKRFEERGVLGLADESRRPDTSPLAVSAEMTIEILRIRTKHPRWGPKKLHRLLELGAKDAAVVPSQRTIARVLDRAGITRRRRRYREPFNSAPKRAPSFTAEAPNDLWTMDFKGWWKTKDGSRCEPLTVRDAYSRFLFAVRIMTSTKTPDVRRVCEELFDRYGLPKAIQSDNGAPFGCTRSPGGLTRLSAWWMSLGIRVIRSRPGKPQDNGAHERVHSDIRIEIQRNAARSLRAQQRICDAWREEFNLVRPHEALGQRTPAEVYRPSPRRPSNLIIGGYPEGCTMTRVNARGRAYNAGEWIYIGAALSRQHVGLQPDGEGVLVWFFDLLLGRFTPGDKSMSPYELPNRNPSSAETPPELSPPPSQSVTPPPSLEVTGVTGLAAEKICLLFPGPLAEAAPV